jgi:hypothetical protein
MTAPYRLARLALFAASAFVSWTFCDAMFEFFMRWFS